MDILKLIDELEEIFDEASNLPFSKKVSVNPDEVYELINDLRDAIPEEIKEARWINEERERILKEANVQADQILNDARNEVERSYQEANRRYKELVNQESITIEAKKQAEQIIADAKVTANTITTNSLAYVDGMLVKTQDELKNLLKVIDENREQLKY
ncbi:MAG: ATPase [Tissierellia bacterium]|nr:ATPase [Tissierellia bacterium]